jgi:glycine/sarcosine N-methyltransferase
MPDDQYAKFDYSRLIAWDDRLKREWPFLDQILGSGPSNRILDLGSGTGDHARFLAEQGFDVTGIEMSESMLERSRSTEAANVRFIAGDMRSLPELVAPGYGGAICVGNVLPHLSEDEDLDRLASGLRVVLERGAPFLLQILNYDRIEIKKERALPLSFLRDPDDPSLPAHRRVARERPGDLHAVHSSSATRSRATARIARLAARGDSRVAPR